MDISTSLAGLAEMHPELEWPDIAGAAVAVLEDSGLESPFPLELQDVPGFGTEAMCLNIDRAGTSAVRVARLRRSYEPSRRTELSMPWKAGRPGRGNSPAAGSC